VLEDGLDHHGIDAPGGHGDPMGVGDELGQRAAVDVKRDYPYPGSTPSSSSSLSQLEVRATLGRGAREVTRLHGAYDRWLPRWKEAVASGHCSLGPETMSDFRPHRYRQLEHRRLS
jgi:hypothetical protein